MQKHNYQDIRQTLKTDVIDYHESYIERALNEFGYDSFPESGLNDEGKSKLISKVMEIAESEASLKKRSDKKSKYLMKKEDNRKKGKLGSLEGIIKNDLKKVGKGLKVAAKVITYPTLGNLVIPTMLRKGHDTDWGVGIPGLWLIGENIIGYLLLGKFAPEAIPYVAGIQLATNIGSGIYEWVRNIRKRAKENYIEPELPL